MACTELPTGEIVAEVPRVGRKDAYMSVAHGRLFADPDSSHNHTELLMYRADPGDFR